MSHIYTEFDGVALPLFDHKQNHSPMPAEPTLIPSIGGAFDWMGSNTKEGRTQKISAPGVYMGETTYIVDEAGNFLVDEAGNFVIAGNATQQLHSQVAALMDKVGARGQLWRKRLHDDALQWKTARLLDVDWGRTWEDHGLKAELTPVFETNMQYWHAEDATSSSGSATAGTPLPLVLSNGGKTVYDAVITVACTSGTVTAVAIECADLGVDLEWTGSLASGNTLTIDCGTQTVPIGVTDAYGNGLRGADHTAAGWFPIAPGVWVPIITTTGGNATVTFTFYEQFA